MSAQQDKSGNQSASTPDIGLPAFANIAIVSIIEAQSQIIKLGIGSNLFSTIAQIRLSKENDGRAIRRRVRSYHEQAVFARLPFSRVN